MLLLFEVISIFLLLALIAWTIFVYLFTRRLFFCFMRGEAPFVPSGSKKGKAIVEALEIGKQDVVFELGSGDARILIECHKAEPEAELVGFEKDIVPYAWSKIRLWRMGLLGEIKIYRKDFFEENLSRATRIFTYLGPRQMKLLEPKLIKELGAGARLVSLNFKLPEMSEKNLRKKAADEDLHIYDFKGVT
jgi:hypothetical protein